MVIEDEKILLKVIEQMLAESGFDVIACESGEQALKALEEKSFSPHVIWLDYHLKGIDGLEFIKKVRSENVCDAPIIVVSNSANDSTVHNLLEAGAAKYMVKAQNRLADIVSVIKGITQDE